MWLGERSVLNPLTQVTMDIWEEEQMMAVILISCEVAPVADGDPAIAALPLPEVGSD